GHQALARRAATKSSTFLERTWSEGTSRRSSRADALVERTTKRRRASADIVCLVIAAPRWRGYPRVEGGPRPHGQPSYSIVPPTALGRARSAPRARRSAAGTLHAARGASTGRQLTRLFRRLSLLQTPCDQCARAIEIPILQRHGAPDAGRSEEHTSE